MYELTIDLNSKSPLYEQIYEFIKEEIKSRRIECKTKLPSTRALAEHLQISRSTVDMAYTQLISEGYIESVPYKGYYVSEVSLLYNFRGTDEKIDIKDEEEDKTDVIDFSPWGIDWIIFR